MAKWSGGYPSRPIIFHKFTLKPLTLPCQKDLNSKRMIKEEKSEVSNSSIKNSSNYRNDQNHGEKLTQQHSIPIQICLVDFSACVVKSLLNHNTSLNFSCQGWWYQTKKMCTSLEVSLAISLALPTVTLRTQVMISESTDVYTKTDY